MINTGKNIDKKRQTRQKVIKNIGLTFIRINPDIGSVDLDVDIARINNYIKESSVRLAVNLAKKTSKTHFTK